MITIGIDMGMGATKLWAGYGGISVQSTVAAATAQDVSKLAGFRSAQRPTLIEIDGAGYYVGPGAHDWGRPIENLNYDRMTGVPETRALVYAALTGHMSKYGPPADRTASLLVGLPLEPLTGEAAQENIRAVRNWLRGEHIWHADGAEYRLTVETVTVTSQPSAAMLDYALDSGGYWLPDRRAQLRGEMGIITVGFNTLEILSVRNQTVIPGMTGGSTQGVRRLLEILNMDGLYTLGELDTMLRAGQLDTRAAIPAWGREVTGAIEKRWGRRWRRFGVVIAVGGGALLLHDTLVRHFEGRVYIPEEPVMSVARGLYKTGRMRANRKRK